MPRVGEETVMSSGRDASQKEKRVKKEARVLYAMWMAMGSRALAVSAEVIRGRMGKYCKPQAGHDALLVSLANGKV
jgi:hypothetical protein